MNSVGKPDAANPHVRFDERGRETEPLAQRLNATAPFLDSTISCEFMLLKHGMYSSGEQIQWIQFG